MQDHISGYRRLLLWVIFNISIFQFSIFTFLACDDVEDFTTDRSAVLQFSRDLVEFDTVITTVPSSTQTLIVYNRGSKGLRISSVHLEKGSASPFRVNVTGQDLSQTTDNYATDFEVWRRDSLIVRMEVTLPDTDSDTPHRVSDNLVFTLESGVQQRIGLTVVGRDARFYRNQTLTANTTITGQRPVVVYGPLTVDEGVTLTLDADALLLFHEGASLQVKGTLKATGSLEKPVILRGDRLDHMFDYLPYDRLPGRWGGVTLAATSTENDLQYIDIHGSEYGICCEASPLETQKLKLVNSRLHSISGDGLSATDCQLEVLNTEISNTLGHCVSLLGGDSRFVHCTLAQFYPLDANRGNALAIDAMENKTYHALVRADFVNCVITGYADDVVLIPSLDKNLSADIANQQRNYQFSNCFMATVVPPGDVYVPRFQNIVFDNENRSAGGHENNFALMDTHAMVYRFTPVAGSAIRGAADPAVAQDYPLDRLGHSRIEDNAPDAGCYEYVP